jgi:putative ABC transport system permease protein
MITTNQPMIIIKDLYYAWDHRFYLSIPYWEAHPYETVVFTGASGCGKSTLLLLLSGMLPIEQGELWVLGAGLHLMNDRQRRIWRSHHIGFVTQNFALLAHLTVQDNILLPQEFLTHINSHVNSHVDSHINITSANHNLVVFNQLTEWLDIQTHIHQNPNQLSQGEQQRVAIARAYMKQPSILLLDEANAHLDEDRALQLSRLIQLSNNKVLREALEAPEAQIKDKNDPELPSALTQHLTPPYLVLCITHRTQDLKYFSQHVDVTQWSYKDQEYTKSHLTSVPIQSTQAQSTKNHSTATPNHLELNHSQIHLMMTQNVFGTTRIKLPFLWKNAFHALTFYKVRSLLLLGTLALTFSFPLLLNQVIKTYQDHLQIRARATPLIAGALGSRYDLALSSLYWSDAQLDDLSWKTWKSMRSLTSAVVVPLHLKWSAQEARIVGTTLDYYRERSLILAQGHLPYRVGEVILGSQVAQRLGIKLNEHIRTDQQDLYNLAATYPMDLIVVGVFKKSGTIDDQACFTDIKTSWIIEGLGHGHQDAKIELKTNLRESSTAKQVVEFDASVLTLQKINSKQSKQFHFHGAMEDFPLSAALIFPPHDKEASLFKARSMRQRQWQVLSSSKVVDEIMSFVLKINTLLQGLGYILIVLTIGLSTFILWLNAQMRQSEWYSLRLLGFKKSQIITIFMSEVFLLGIALLSLIIIFYMVLIYLLPYYGYSLIEYLTL